MFDNDDDTDDDGDFADLEGSAWVGCPYCGSEVEILIDQGGGAEQEYVEDCEICCQPWRVHLRILPDGTPRVEVTTLDEG